MERFDESGADDLAVVDAEGRILGMLTEEYVRKRHADGIDRSETSVAKMSLVPCDPLPIFRPLTT
jgi:hypothetical protein